MGCYNCKYLKYEDKKDGALNGCVYYCTKLNKYVNGAADACDNYSKDYSRKTHEKDEIYNNGRNYNNDATPTSVYLFILIIMLIFAFIVNVFKIC